MTTIVFCPGVTLKIQLSW